MTSVVPSAAAPRGGRSGAEPGSVEASYAGMIVGRYRIIEKIGEGGMGVVFEAEQEKPKRRVALKLIRGGQLADDLSLRLFEREAEMLGRLDHPGIAAIYEAGRTPDGQSFLAMELVRGRTFDAYLQGRGPGGAVVRDPASPPSPATPGATAAPLAKAELRRRLKLFLDVCDAVHYAHQRGVIHRDLKPSNIIVTDPDDEPRVKILDFGLARMTDPSDADAAMLSRTGSIRGTLAYMSPEQVRGRPGEVDVRSDVYALGVVLYQMISGSLPYDVTGRSILEAARTIAEKAPKALTSIAGKAMADAELRTIISKSLEKDPAARYSSAAALRDDVERYLSDQPILARAPSSAYQLRKMIARNRGAFLAAVSGLGLLVVFVVVLAVLYRRADLSFQRAVAAEKKAATEAGTARQVSDFLTGLFEVSNPEEARGNKVTARELLDQGSARIRTQLADRPEVQGRLMQTMGMVYSQLGLYKEARDLLTQSIERTQAAERARGLFALSVVENRLGKNEEARKRIEEALVIDERDLGQGSSEVLRDQIQLAEVLDDLGKYEESRALFERTLPELERSLGPGTRAVAVARMSYGNLLQNLRDHKGALAQYEGSLRVLEKILPADHPLLGDVLQSIANAHALLQDFESAKRFRLRAIAIQEKSLGEDHPKTIADRENLAMIYSETGDHEHALEIIAGDVGRWERTLGPDHPNVAQALNNLGYTLYLMHRYDEARAPLERAYRLRLALLGEDHLSTNLTRFNLANLYTELRRFADAKPLLLRALEIDVKTVGENSEDVLTDLESYADLLKRSGQRGDLVKVEARMAAIKKTLAEKAAEKPAENAPDHPPVAPAPAEKPPGPSGEKPKS